MHCNEEYFFSSISSKSLRRSSQIQKVYFVCLQIFFECNCSWKSNLLIGDLRRKSRKEEEEFKEIMISNYDLDIKTPELTDTINKL